MIDGNRLKEIEERLEGATPGPWETSRYDFHEDLIHTKDDRYPGPVAVARPREDWDWDQVERNALFIAACPEDIRFLLKTVYELRAELSREQSSRRRVSARTEP